MLKKIYEKFQRKIAMVYIHIPNFKSIGFLESEK